MYIPESNNKVGKPLGNWIDSLEHFSTQFLDHLSEFSVCQSHHIRYGALSIFKLQTHLMTYLTVRGRFFLPFSPFEIPFFLPLLISPPMLQIARSVSEPSRYRPVLRICHAPVSCCPMVRYRQRGDLVFPVVGGGKLGYLGCGTKDGLVEEGVRTEYSHRCYPSHWRGSEILLCPFRFPDIKGFSLDLEGLVFLHRKNYVWNLRASSLPLILWLIHYFGGSLGKLQGFQVLQG